jgi:O-antigen/teichoic acid export membrane protein
MRAADLVLGRTHGAAEVGFYRIGEEIGHLPGTELVAPLNRVLLPGMSQLFESGRPTGEVVVTATGVVGLVLIPACLGISAVADPLVRVMLGDQWLPAIPIVQLMALNSLFRALWANQHTTLLAYGDSRVAALIAVARFAVFAPCVFLLVEQGGAGGVATSALLSSIVALLFGLGASLPMFDVRLGAYLRVLWRPVLAGIVMWVVVNRLLEAWSANSTLAFDTVRLLVAVSAGCLTYLLMMVVLYLIAGKPMGTERLLLDRVRDWRQRHADLRTPNG